MTFIVDIVYVGKLKFIVSFNIFYAHSRLRLPTFDFVDVCVCVFYQNSENGAITSTMVTYI